MARGRAAVMVPVVAAFPIMLVVAAARVVLPPQVVLCADATETEKWAANKLAELLALPLHTIPSCGDSLPTGTRNVSTGAFAQPQVAVGYGAAVLLGVPAGVLDCLGDDSFLVSTEGARGVPVGSAAVASSTGSARGSLHGVFALLRALGFEFFAPNATRVPSFPVALPDVDVVYTPQVEPLLWSLQSVGTAAWLASE
eukprot:COSAG01_NODE_8162_length_2895_cov_2.185265_1_plen_198_part_00